MDYYFYFDEAFHDRKIRINEKGKLNTKVPNALDNYVGVFLGEDYKTVKTNQLIFQEFEKINKNRFGLDESKELKSDIVGQKNYKYGIRSFNKKSYLFYYDFFKMMNDIDPILHINVISKIELLIRSIFINVENEDIINNAFYYTLIKFFDKYGNSELYLSLFNIKDEESLLEFKKILIKQLNHIIKEINGIKRKEKEIPAFIQLRNIICTYNINIVPKSNIEYWYDLNFDGLINLLEENSINVYDTCLLIDKEKGTLESADKFKFKQVTGYDSRLIIQLRISDLLAGFIGRMMYALANDETISEDRFENIKDIGKLDLERKRLLSEDWFDINIEQYNLYCLVYDLIIEKQGSYWATMTCIYFDNFIMFLSLIRYFKMYNSFCEFKKESLYRHTEIFNTYVLNTLQEEYRKF